MKLSATRLKIYFTCPRQFKYAYIEEIPAVPTGPLVFGQVIHQVLHQVHTISRQEQTPLSAETALSEFDRVWREALEQHRPLFKNGETEVQEYWNLADDMLRAYVASQQDQPPPLVQELPFELSLELANGGCAITNETPNQAEHYLAGVVDRIDEASNGLIIVDYKTGKRKPSERELAEDLQLTIYAFAIEQLLDQPVERIVYHRLRYGQSLVTTRSRSEFRQLCDEVLPHAIAAIEAQRFEPRYGYWCRFCDYRELCQAEGPDGSNSVGNVVSSRSGSRSTKAPDKVSVQSPVVMR